MSGLDVQLGHVVSEVRRDGEGFVITTRTEEKFQADRVVVAVPLGVLKHR